MPLQKARLVEVDSNDNDRELGNELIVQFNPESLKVTYTNQVTQGSSSAGGQQHVGPGATKLAVQLWFDLSAATPVEGAEPLTDVRQLTEKVVYFITPKTPEGGGQPRRSGRGRRGDSPGVPPVLRFVWGTFKFDGVVESLDESLEFFSPEGHPLRASVSLSLSRPRITTLRRDDPNTPTHPALPGRAPAGTAPLTAAPAGSSVQRMTGQRSGGDSSGWRDVAEANGIEDPLRLSPGTLLDLSPADRGRA